MLPVEGGVPDACARVDWSASGCLGARTGAPLLAHDIIPGGEAGLLVWQLRVIALLRQPPVAPSHLLGGEMYIRQFSAGVVYGMGLDPTGCNDLLIWHAST